MSVNDREVLIDDFLTLHGNHDIKKLNQLIEEIQAYLSVNESDVKLGYILRVLQILKIDRQCDRFKQCCEIAEPILNELKDTNTWDSLTLNIFCSVINYSSSYMDAHNLAQKVFDILPDYKDGSYIKQMLCINMTSRLLLAKYKDISPRNQDLGQVKELREIFSNYLQQAIDFCEKHNETLFKKGLAVRKALFDFNCDAVFAGFEEIVREKGREAKEFLKLVQAESMEYLFQLLSSLTSEQRHIVVGFQIRRRREELRWTTEDLADALNTNPSYINQLERGAAGAGLDRLIEIADILEVGVSYLLGDMSDKPGPDFDPYLHHISILFKDATDKQKQFVLDHAKLYMAQLDS